MAELHQGAPPAPVETGRLDGECCGRGEAGASRAEEQALGATPLPRTKGACPPLWFCPQPPMWPGAADSMALDGREGGRTGPGSLCGPRDPPHTFS